MGGRGGARGTAAAGLRARAGGEGVPAPRRAQSAAMAATTGAAPSVPPPMPRDKDHVGVPHHLRDLVRGGDGLCPGRVPAQPARRVDQLTCGRRARRSARCPRCSHS